VAASLALLTVFCALARGAHDLWAATLVYWALLALAAACVARASLRDEPLSREFVPALLAGAALLGLSALGAANPAAAVFACSDWLAAAVAFWLALRALRSDKAVRTFTALVAPFFWMELAVIVYQLYAVHYLVPVPKSVLYPGIRELWIFLAYSVPGTMVNSNATAAFHLLWLPVLARRALDERRSPYWTASAACCLLGILLLNSTSAKICVLLGAPFIAGPNPVLDWVRRRPGVARSAAGGLAAAVAVLLLYKLMRSDDGSGTSITWAAKVSRLGWWSTGLRMFAAHPWLGVGPGNFPSAFLAHKSGPIPNTLFAHSFPVGVLAETGLAGLAALSIFAAAWLRRAELRSRWPFVLGAAMILGYTTINIGFEYLANLLCAALFLGIAAAPAVQARWRPARLVAVLTAALCLTAAVYAAVPFVASRAQAAGDAALKEGDAAAALKSYESAIQVYPLSSEARAGRARSLYVRARAMGSREDMLEAIAELERAIARDRDNPALRAELEAYKQADAPAN